jgi:rfaE bifunctional protein kinase chain/domain
MNRQQLETLLSAVRKVRIGVIGDFCLDAYWELDPSLSEISVETGLATRPVRSQRYSLGGAGNVVNNLVAMGVGAVSAFGVLGDDPFGREMLRILQGCGVATRGIVVQGKGWNTPVYVKPVEAQAEQARIDFGNANLLDPAAGTAVLSALSGSLADLDLVIINQQLLHGIHTEGFRAALAGISGTARIPFICDSRDWNDSYAGAIRKLNDREAMRQTGSDWRSDDPVPRADALAAADALFKRWKRTVFVTRGPRGMLMRDAQGTSEVLGLQLMGRIDTVGAGDSALSGIAAALACGRGALEAAELGNLVAGVTVQKLFITGTASPQEILAIGTAPEFVHNPELAEDPRAACFHPGSEIEIISPPPRGTRITHAIFDNDGTISTLREGWEIVMEPVLTRAILGEGWKTVEERVYRSVQENVREFIDKTTGVQTLVQMHGLVDMVRDFGAVPKDKVLTPQGYKDVYNKELLALVADRIAKLQRGERCVEDYQVKGAFPFLTALKAAGVKLHLASGTDEPDVIAEAEALGHAALFEGRIHGSVGDVKIEAKKVVLERILAEISSEGSGAVVTFGDGPVEMRETKRRGGITVGVASDELRRFGWNMRKRSRLIKAGADLVVPDFSQWKMLLGVLEVQ